jgi:hypothetical protein
LLVTGIAAAAISPTYSVNGIGSAASSLEFRFIGIGAGSGGDRLTWRTNLDHTLLSPNPATPASITGGTLTAASRGGGTNQLNGEFTGGTITFNPALSSPRPCGDEVYDVTGTVELDGWTGTFTVQLTQNRLRLLGRCFNLTATVTGSPGLTLTPAAATTPPPPPTPPPGGEF